MFCRVIPVIATLLLSFSPAGHAQVENAIVGTYTLKSVVATRSDGNIYDAFGADPKGTLMLAENGRYSLLVLRHDLPKFASNNRAMGTPEENKAIVQGSNGHYGTYTISDSPKTINFRVEFGTYPNWNGAEQRRVFSIVGDELKYTVQGGSAGSQSTVLTWQRAR